MEFKNYGGDVIVADDAFCITRELGACEHGPEVKRPVHGVHDLALKDSLRFRASATGPGDRGGVVFVTILGEPGCLNFFNLAVLVSSADFAPGVGGEAAEIVPVACDIPKAGWLGEDSREIAQQQRAGLLQ